MKRWWRSRVPTLAGALALMNLENLVDPKIDDKFKSTLYANPCRLPLSLGALGIMAGGMYFDSQILYALADFGLMINLFNLMPIGTLDGGRVAGALSKYVHTCTSIQQQTRTQTRTHRHTRVLPSAISFLVTRISQLDLSTLKAYPFFHFRFPSFAPHLPAFLPTCFSGSLYPRLSLCHHFIRRPSKYSFLTHLP
jgi:hypothetical protein